MTINIHFDTGNLSREEGIGLSALLAAIQPALLPSSDLREHQKSLYGSPGLIGNSAPVKQGEVLTAVLTQNPNVDKPEPEQTEVQAEEPAKRTRRKKEDAPVKAAISSGEERVNPEEEAQDQADEAAEADQGPGRTFTADDVRDAMGLYVNKFGMDAAQEDGPGLLVDVLGAPPAGNLFWKLSIIPADKYEAVRDAWVSAATGVQRYKRKGA
ncbi:MAG: hypothetical protein ACOVN5_07045 [Aquidulcibacter sp.]